MNRFSCGLAALAAPTLALAVGCAGQDRPLCPQGQYHNGMGCVPVGGGQCPPGQVFNGTMCAAVQQCPLGQTWNGAMCACPPGQTWNGTACAPAPTPCPPGQTWNGAMCACPSGQTWNGSACVPVPGGQQCAPAEAATPAMMPAISQGLALLGQQHAPAGSRAVGSAVAGKFRPGQCLLTPITMQPGKCYTVVGFGAPGVVEVDVQLVPILPIGGMPILPLAQDNTSGTTAVLGGKPNCFTSIAPVPIQVNMVLLVTSGQGGAGAQVFEK